MFSPALNSRLLPRNVRKPACALGICSMALMLAVSVGVDPNNPANASQAAPSPRLQTRRRNNKPDPKDPKKVIFVEPPGGSLIHQRAIDAAIQEHVRPEDEVRTLRMSTNTLGNGFVEMIPDEDILKIRRGQPAGLKGLPVLVPVVVRAKKGADGELEFEFVERIGRFGWKLQSK